VLTAAGSPLVGGAARNADTASGRVLRPFLIKSERQEIGLVLTLDRRLATELASNGKLELLKPEEVAAAAVADLKQETPKPPRAKRSTANAGQ
jgi:hypothetical protein